MKQNNAEEAFTEEDRSSAEVHDNPISQAEAEGAAGEAIAKNSDGASSNVREILLDSGDRAIEEVAADAESRIQEFKEENMKKKIPLAFKVFGVINIIMGVMVIPLTVILVAAIAGFVEQIQTASQSVSLTAFVLSALTILLLIALGVMYILVGIRLLRDKRRLVSQLAYVMIVLCILLIVCSICVGGVNSNPVLEVINLVYLVVLATFIDPSLREERELQRKLRDMETRTDAEEGTLGRDKTGKGYIKLDFFNMFWIFIIGCVVGLVFETFYVGFTTGVWQNRTGMLWGPFSPIYGIGALLMAIALNRFYDKNIFITYIVSAFIGAAFEYLVSYILQAAFGIVAWDYSDSFMNIDGRTDLFHFLAWGLLGTIFIRWLMPLLLKVVNLIPWKWRYSVTAVFAAFMLVNATLTLVSFDRWFERLSGIPPQTAIEQWVDETYPNEWMANHFQSISIDPENATRMDSTAGMVDGAAGTT